MLEFLASLTLEQQAMLTAALTFGIVFLIKRRKPEWEQGDIDRMKSYVQAVATAVVLAVIQNAADWDWHKVIAAAIVGFLGSQALYTTNKAAGRLIGT